MKPARRNIKGKVRKDPVGEPGSKLPDLFPRQIALSPMAMHRR